MVQKLFYNTLLERDFYNLLCTFLLLSRLVVLLNLQETSDLSYIAASVVRSGANLGVRATATAAEVHLPRSGEAMPRA